MKKLILIKMFVISINMFFEDSLFKDTLRNATIILWQSLSSVSLVQVLQKNSGLSVSIRSSKGQLNVLKQVWILLCWLMKTYQ